ncbi:MAG: hypothetical protein ABUJ92_00755 [Desulfobacterales bacterium]
MTASQEAKQIGVPSLEWAARQIGKPSQTLRNWHRENHNLFRAVIVGVNELRKSGVVE